MRGHAPTHPSSSRPPNVHERWRQPRAASSRSGAPQPCAKAAASSPVEAVEKVVDRRALLAANATYGCPAGGEIGDGDHWQIVLLPGPAERAANGRDAPVEKGR